MGSLLHPGEGLAGAGDLTGGAGKDKASGGQGNHHDDGNRDQMRTAAQDAEEGENEPNDEEGGGNDDENRRGGNADAAGVIWDSGASLVVGTAEGRHGHDSNGGSISACMEHKMAPAARRHPELEMHLADARERIAAAIVKKQVSQVWANARPSIKVAIMGCVRAQGAVAQDSKQSLAQGFDRHVDYNFQLNVGDVTWPIERSYADIKAASDALEKIKLPDFGLRQPDPSDMAKFLEAVANSRRAWNKFPTLVVELCDLRKVYDHCPSMKSTFLNFPHPHW